MKGETLEEARAQFWLRAAVLDATIDSWVPFMEPYPHVSPEAVLETRATKVEKPPSRRSWGVALPKPWKGGVPFPPLPTLCGSDIDSECGDPPAPPVPETPATRLQRSNWGLDFASPFFRARP